MKFRLLLVAAAMMTVALVPLASFASTECSSKVVNIYAGDNGRVYIIGWGPGGYFESSNPNQKNALALATSALLSDKNLRWRFAANGVPCNNSGIRSDLEGVWLDR